MDYRDYDATTKSFTNAVRECTLVTSETRTLASGWYAVRGTVRLPDLASLTVRGDVRLVLCDGSSLTVPNAAYHEAGVAVGIGNSLAVYGQAAGSGRLTATGGEWGAGVGGDYEDPSGAITINGGTVTATGGSHAAGIGSGYFWNIAIKGQCAVTVNGGTVTATGGERGAGIGGGYNLTNGTVTVNGGTVTATGRRGAGIGGGDSCLGCTVTITGGKVFARGTEAADAEGIGHGSGCAESGTVRISGGLFGMPVSENWFAEGVLPCGNTDPATHEDYPIAARPGHTVTTGQDPRVTVAWTGGDRSVTNISAGVRFHVPQGTTDLLAVFTVAPGYEYEGADEIELGTLTGDLVFGEGNDYSLPRVRNPLGDIPYLDWNGETRVDAVLRAECSTLLTESTRTLVDGGWYVVTNDLDFGEGANLTVCGDAHLILTDGSSLTITNVTARQSGVAVNKGASLEIFGQTGDTGVLRVRGCESCAGIGGGRFISCGNVTVNGGTVTARGDGCAAGIGGGDDSEGGAVTVNAGRVTAIGGEGGSDFGMGSSAAVAIRGGIFGRSIRDDWCVPRHKIFDNADPETREDYPYEVLPACTVTIGTDHPHVTAEWMADGDTEGHVIVDGVFSIPRGTEDVRVIFTVESGYTLDGDETVSLGEVTDDIVFGEGRKYRVPRAYCDLGDIPYLDWDGEKRTNAVLSAYDYTLLTDAMRMLEGGWYVVSGDIVLPKGASLTVQGDVHLVLCDKASLAVTNVNDLAAAIAVGEGTSLTVYGQTASDNGSLTALGGDCAAGIGGGYQNPCGVVTINGGAIRTKGGVGAPDIGPGQGGYGGQVSIRGGVFARPVQAAWCADHCAAFANPDPLTRDDYPYAVLPAYKVTIGPHPYVDTVWTGNDGVLIDTADGEVFAVPQGTRDVRVEFTASRGCSLVGATTVNLGTLTGDLVFGEGNDYRVPEAVIAYLDWDDVQGMLTNAFLRITDEWKRVTIDQTAFTGGWYVVMDDIEIPEGQNITVYGESRLILCDGSSLKVGNPKLSFAGVQLNHPLTIYGQDEGTGLLEAQGDSYAAGIGGGYGTPGGTLTINGGTVTAQGSIGAAGIGGGWEGAGGEVTINGGTVTAKSGARDNDGGAGIGGGHGGGGGIVAIRGGCVTAQGGSGAEDIGRGSGSSVGESVVLSGGIFARPVKREWCTDHADLFDNPDPATREAYPYAVLPMHKVDLGDHPGIFAAWTSGDGTVKNAIAGTFFKVRPGTENVRVLFAAPDPFALVGDAEVNLGTVTDDIVFGEGADYKLPRVACPYLDYDWLSGKMTNAIVWAERCTVVTNDMPALADGGWYAVTNAVAFGEGKRLEVVGAAHLILCDNASLTIAKPGSNNAAVSVGDAASLSIYAQTAGSGRLEVNGGAYAAGIGGDLEVAGGAVTINGGIVTATGGDCAAGIGGGDMAAGGVVAIHGGRVTAQGGSGAEDIGRGARGGESGTVAITGGLFWHKPADAWIVAGCEAVANTDETTKDEYPWEVRDRRFRVTPGQRSRSFTERSSAEAAMSRAVISPSRDVAAVLTTDEALNRYADWFTFRIVVTHDLVRYYYAIEAVLTDAAKLRLAESAQEATRQIPVADIAALSTDGKKDVSVTNCEPGFYYTLRGSGSLGGLGGLEGVDAYGPDLCGLDGKFEFPSVKKPSDAAGFFHVGVSEAK